MLEESVQLKGEEEPESGGAENLFLAPAPALPLLDLKRVHNSDGSGRSSWEAEKRLTCRWWPERGFIEIVVSKVRKSAGGRRSVRSLFSGELTSASVESRLIASATRARKSVYHKCLTLGVDRLLTLTYRENVTQLKVSEKHLQEFIRLVRKKISVYPYVAVWERQKRGAIHWHLAVVGYQDVEMLRRCWLSAIGSYQGNIDVTAARDCSPIKLASYLTKYITKDQGTWVPGQRRFRCSVGVAVPKQVYYIGAVSIESALATAQAVVRDTVGEAATVAVRTGGAWLNEWGHVTGLLT